MVAPNPKTVIQTELVSKYTIGKTEHQHIRFTYLNGETEMKEILIPDWSDLEFEPLATLKKPYQ